MRPNPREGPAAPSAEALAAMGRGEMLALLKASPAWARQGGSAEARYKSGAGLRIGPAPTVWG